MKDELCGLLRQYGEIPKTDKEELLTQFENFLTIFVEFADHLDTAIKFVMEWQVKVKSLTIF